MNSQTLCSDSQKKKGHLLHLEGSKSEAASVPGIAEIWVRKYVMK